jgi:hypothetical protein
MVNRYTLMGIDALAAIIGGAALPQALISLERQPYLTLGAALADQ